MGVQNHKGEKRASDGRFVKGHCGGPGRKRGRINIYDACRRQAELEGVDLHTLVWGVMKGLAVHASKGNAKCAKLVLEYLGNPIEKALTNATQVNVAVDASQKNEGEGPPVPSPEVLREQLVKLAEFAASNEQIKIIDTKPMPAAQAAIDALLS